MNRTSIIKKTIGNVIQEKGFAYVRREKRIIYDFKRKEGDVEQHVYIQQHTIVDPEYKIMLYTTAKGHGMKEIVALQEPVAAASVRGFHIDAFLHGIGFFQFPVMVLG